MTTRLLSEATIKETLRVFKKNKGNQTKTARELGIGRSTLQQRLDIAKAGRIREKRDAEIGSIDDLVRDLAEALKANPQISQHQWEVRVKVAQPKRYLSEFGSWVAFKAAALRTLPDEDKAPPRALHALIRKGPATVAQIRESFQLSERGVYQAIERARAAGFNIHRRGEVYTVDGSPAPLDYDKSRHLFQSDARGCYRFGLISDNHIGSKYARLDVLNDLYDIFAAEGVDRVYNCGNWIDGQARFNQFDLEPWAHGVDEQIRAFVREYPVRKGITTYYVAGDDHEGWYVQSTGLDIGAYAEKMAREAGRTDLVYLGYMEAFILMQHAKTRAVSRMAVVHPGGGSAYAISYSPQKIVESYQGGEKPAVVCLGHYHKMDVFNYRNVWILQCGCTQDQTPFMRKKRIEAHVGGIVVELRQDERGAITGCRTDQRRYFDRGYYNYQFDRAASVRRVAA